MFTGALLLTVLRSSGGGVPPLEVVVGTILVREPV